LRVTLFRRRFWLPATRAAGLGGLRIFTLDRYGHLYPEADLSLRERLDAIWSASGGGSMSACGPSAVPAGTERLRGPATTARECVDLLVQVVGVTGLEPVTSSL
jgi:hypothetical protein